ncbi:hypothetical protein C2845_PM07G20180 [Panicum miliaceum]|uniref:Major facilitator superfamily (MFS) profile domain-containing protein n=1 Tax=Panicum miliaceum TaxID=4540 RepID=A0A3L6SIS6_PANMI|nr:hypothetical protein C2845_PM07G20180 [Panicum miliaceum]
MAAEGEFKPAAMGVEGAETASSKSRFRMPVDSDNKATEFWLFSFARPHMTPSTWRGSPSAASCPPLRRRRRCRSSATRWTSRPRTSATPGSRPCPARCSRLGMGTACDLVGPRLASASIILLTTPAVYCSSIMNSALAFLLARFFTGIALASFVSTHSG